MKSKLVIVALLAFAAGGTCPSDVNNDGTVGINDFLQLLSEWGPCPNPTIVGVGASGSVPNRGWAIRVWSDGRIDALVSYLDASYQPTATTPVSNINLRSPEHQPRNHVQSRQAVSYRHFLVASPPQDHPRKLDPFS